MTSEELRANRRAFVAEITDGVEKLLDERRGATQNHHERLEEHDTVLAKLQGWWESDSNEIQTLREDLAVLAKRVAQLEQDIREINPGLLPVDRVESGQAAIAMELKDRPVKNLFREAMEKRGIALPTKGHSRTIEDLKREDAAFEKTWAGGRDPIIVARESIDLAIGVTFDECCNRAEIRDHLYDALKVLERA